jgi:hypothetical protein
MIEAKKCLRHDRFVFDESGKADETHMNGNRCVEIGRKDSGKNVMKYAKGISEWGRGW